MEEPSYDVVVVGGGAAGLSAALVLGRARRRVAVVDAGAPRNAPAAHMQGFLSRGKGVRNWSQNDLMRMRIIPDEDTDGGFANGGWTHQFFDPEVVGGAFAAALAEADALLFGRRTWQTMAAAWPERAGDPFADQMNAIPKYVVSETLGDGELTWDNTTRISVDGIRELRAADGGDLVVMGSPTLVRTLLHERLVDELRLILMPVILGGGKTIFPDDGALQTLELVSTLTSGTGAHVSTYRPVSEV